MKTNFRTEEEMRNHLRSVESLDRSDLDSKKWLVLYDAFKEQSKGKSRGEICLNKELSAWFNKNRFNANNNSIVEWKRDALAKINFFELIKEKVSIGKRKSTFSSLEEVEKYLKSNSLNLTKTDRNSASWISKLKKYAVYVSNIAEFDAEKFDKDLLLWCKKNKYRYLNKTHCKWKMDALKGANFDRYCKLGFAKLARSKPSSANEMKYQIGERNLDGKITAIDKQSLEWLKLLEEYKKLAYGSKKIKEISIELKKWLRTNKSRYLKGTLPAWKISSLKEADFDVYCKPNPNRFKKQIFLLRVYYKKFGSYKVTQEHGFMFLYKWRNTFCTTASKHEIRSFFSLVPEMKEIDKDNFLRIDYSLDGENEYDPPQEYISASTIADHLKIEERFKGLTAQQASKILRRLSVIAPMTSVQLFTLNWLNDLCNLQTAMTTQKKDIFTVEKSRELGVFVNINRKKFLGKELHGWQTKFLSEIEFEEYATSAKSQSQSEKIVSQLKAYYDKTGSIAVTRDHVDLYRWRQRTARRFAEIPEQDWESRPVFLLMKTKFQNLSIEEWREFFNIK